MRPERFVLLLLSLAGATSARAEGTDIDRVQQTMPALMMRIYQPRVCTVACQRGHAGGRSATGTDPMPDPQADGIPPSFPAVSWMTAA